jgi:hypothetical protein
MYSTIFQQSTNNSSANTMFELTLVTSQAIDRDGIGYTLSVYRGSNGSFTAFWECRHCADQGNLPIPASDRDSAIANCNARIDHHHTQHHLNGNE